MVYIFDHLLDVSFTIYRVLLLPLTGYKVFLPTSS